jgi:type III pantothenate kinase
MIVINKMDALIIQIGNTSIKWGLFQGRDLVKTGRVFDFNNSELTQVYSESSCIFFSCEASDNIKSTFKNTFPKALEISDSAYPSHRYNEGKPGYDRLANVAAASELFPNEPCLIVDFGTCITYTICDNHELIQGAISPGVYLRYNAMHEGTGKLPLIETNVNFQQRFGQSTKTNLEAGVCLGVLHEINGFIELAKKDFANIQILFTGSDLAFFEKHIQYPIFVEENLTLIGLRKIIS